MFRLQLSVEKQGENFISLNQINLSCLSLKFGYTYVIREWANCSSHRHLASRGASKRTLIFHLKSHTQLTQGWVACVTFAVLTVIRILIPSDPTISMEPNLFGKLTFLQRLKKFPTFYWTRIFITISVHIIKPTNVCIFKFKVCKSLHHYLSIFPVLWQLSPSSGTQTPFLSV
jgi:hypothetical protein